MPDFGIGEAIAAFGGADILGGLFGGAEAATGAGFFAGDALAAGAGPFAAAGGDALGAGTALGFGSEAGAGGIASAAGPVFDSSLSPSSWLGWSSADAATGAPISSGTFGTGATGAVADPLGGGGPGVLGAGADPLAAGGTAPGGGTGFLDSVTGGGGRAATGGGGSSGNFLDQIVTGAGNQITRNPLGIGLAGAGLASTLFSGQQTPRNMPQVQGQADQLGRQGAELSNYLASGTLPPGLQSAVRAGTDAARARIISNYASRGMSTDPSQNSALQQELANLDQQATITTAQIGQQLLQSGLSESQLSSQLYQYLINADRQQSQDTGNAIARFAAALGGGGGGGGQQFRLVNA